MTGSERGGSGAGRTTGSTRSASPAKRPASEMEGVEQVEETSGAAHDQQQQIQKAPSNLAAEYGARTTEDSAMSGMTPANNVEEDAQEMDASTSSADLSSTTTAASSTESVSALPSGEAAEEQLQATHKEPYSTEEVDRQVAHVHTLVAKPLDEGDRGVVISSKWLERVMSRSTEGLDSRQYAKDAREGPVGPLDNSDITPADAFQKPLQDVHKQSFIPLNPGYAVGKEIQVFPYEVYGYIVGLYGTKHSKPIVRYAHDSADSDTAQNIIYETYPPIVTICKVPQPDQQITTPANRATLAAASLKLRRERHEMYGQHTEDDAIRIVVSRSERIQKFLARAKEAAGIPRARKVKVFRLLEQADGAVALSGNGRAGVPSPPPSRPASPDQSTSPPKLVLDATSFNKMKAGVNLEPVDIKDNTANEKYNGSMALGAIIYEDQTLVFEEQIGGPAGGEFPSDSKPGMNIKMVKPTDSAATSGRTSPAPSGMMTRGRQTRSGRTPGTVGLNNLGNTCYMNSALQCIRSVEELAIFFLKKHYKKEINNDNPLGHNGAMANAYHSVIQGIYGNPNLNSFQPTQFKKALGNAQPMFSGWGQQDSQEFLSFLVDALHEDLNRIIKKPYIENPDSDDATVHDPQAIIELGETYRNNHRLRNDSVAMDLFSGFYKNKMECPTCDKVSVTFDPFSLLTVQLPINVKREHDVIFFPIHGKPVRHHLDIESNAPYKALKETIASKHPGVDANRLIMTEVFSHKTYKLFNDAATLADDNIAKGDHIFFYEVDDVPTNPALPERPYAAWNERNAHKVLPADAMNSPQSECMAIPIFHQTKGNHKDWQAAMHPMYITVTREEAKHYDVILKKILIAVSKMTTRPILQEFSQDKGEELIAKAQSIEGEEAVSAEDAAGVSDHSNTSEESYVNVDMATPATEITDSQILANGTSAMQIEENTNSIPEGFMSPTYRLSPALRDHLFDVLVGGSGNDLHTISIPPSRNSQSMNSRVKIPSRQSSVESSDSGDSGSDDDDTAEQGDGQDDQNDDDVPDIVMGGEQSRSIVEESDSEDPIVGPKTFSPKVNKPRKGRGRSERKKFNRLNKKNRHGGQKKKDSNSYGNSLVTPPPRSEDSPYYVELGEGIVLNWRPEAFDALFEGNPKKNNEMRGCRTADDDGKDCDFFPDPELEARRAKMQARKKSGVTLDECFTETGKREVLSEDNAWYCNRCKEMRLAAKTLEIWTLPDILVVHLKRFGGARGSRDKIDVHVNYPITGLDMSDKVGLKEDGKEYIYDLFAVDNHYGGLGGGHYTAMAKNFNDGEWYDYNGESAFISGQDLPILTVHRLFLLQDWQRGQSPLRGCLPAVLPSSLGQATRTSISTRHRHKLPRTQGLRT